MLPTATASAPQPRRDPRALSVQRATMSYALRRSAEAERRARDARRELDGVRAAVAPEVAAEADPLARLCAAFGIA